MESTYYIGTSGWTYEGWKGLFYPSDLPDAERLIYYSQHFNTVELNSSFYHLPRAKTVTHWAEITPANFIFSCKASRYLTHIKKLSDYQNGLKNLFNSLENLHEKLGPILFQLPPKWALNLERLSLFLSALPTDYQYTFEFRDRSWLCNETFDLLKKFHIALCFYDFRGYQAPYEVLSDFIYLRLHGPLETPYEGHYPNHSLLQYAKHMHDWSKSESKIFCYFDNDQKVAAPQDAKQLIKLLQKQTN